MSIRDSSRRFRLWPP